MKCPACGAADLVRLAYRISLDEYQGRQRVQMVVEGVGT